MTMRQSVMLSDRDVPGSDSASTVALNQTEPLASSAAPPSPLWRAAFALAAAEEASPVSAAVRWCLLGQSQGAGLQYQSERKSNLCKGHQQHEVELQLWEGEGGNRAHVAAVCAAHCTSSWYSELHHHNSKSLPFMGDGPSLLWCPLLLHRGGSCCLAARCCRGTPGLDGEAGVQASRRVWPSSRVSRRMLWVPSVAPMLHRCASGKPSNTGRTTSCFPAACSVCRQLIECAHGCQA